MALKAAFGSAPLQALQPITIGASALIYRIEVRGWPYLLRLESLVRDEVRDPGRAYLCMRAAADAGIAPALHYADATAGVAIMDFVPGRPLQDHPNGAEGLARDLGTLAARLQATPAFAPVADYPTILRAMLDRLLATDLYGGGLLDPHRDGFERIREAYPWDEAVLVSSHNDPHPGNILFDGARLWLIDWETAYRNDPAVDVAVMTLYLANTPELQEALIRSWLGRASDPVLRARLVLMRQLVKLFYGFANGLYVAGSQPGLVETDMAALTPAEFRLAMDDKRLIPNSPEAQRVGGKVALRSFIDGLATPAFAEALAIVH